MTWTTAELEAPTPGPVTPVPGRGRRRVLKLALLTVALSAAPAAATVIGSDDPPAGDAAVADALPAPPPTGPPAPSGTAAQTTTDPPSTAPPPALLAPAAPAPVGTGPGSATYAYGPDPDQLLDLHGADPAVARPAIVYLHSGGWTSGSRANLPDFVTAQLARGWVVASVEFALAPAQPHPAPDADVDRAVRWLAHHGPALGIRSDALVLLGTSSGGQLALNAAATPGRFADPTLPAELAATAPSLAGVVAVAAPTDLAALLLQPEGWGPVTVAAYLGCASTCDPAVVRAATPAENVGPNPPPALLVHGELDTLAPAGTSGARLAAAWAAAGGEATVLEAVGYGHNLGVGAGFDLVAFEAFLDRVTGG